MKVKTSSLRKNIEKVNNVHTWIALGAIAAVALLASIMGIGILDSPDLYLILAGLVVLLIGLKFKALRGWGSGVLAIGGLYVAARVLGSQSIENANLWIVLGGVVLAVLLYNYKPVRVLGLAVLALGAFALLLQLPGAVIWQTLQFYTIVGAVALLVVLYRFRRVRILALGILTVSALSLLIKLYYPDLPPPAGDSSRNSINNPWPDPIRQDYYHRSQGSQVMPYEWFIALEQPTSQQSLISPEVLTRFRLLADVNPVHNEHRLPLGFSVDDPDPITGVRNIGITCAACHTGQLQYKGQLIRIEGGSGLMDFDRFIGYLGLSVATTVSPLRPGKFTRFAEKVLGEEDFKDAKKVDALKKEVTKWVEEQLQQVFFTQMMDRAHQSKATKSGFGRIDALGAGGNALYAKFSEENIATLNAPVTAPPLWYAHRYGWVQLNGSIRQPTSRNIIEAIAVNAHIVLPGDPAYTPENMFLSSIRVENMVFLEAAMAYLQAPEWPEKVFGKLDQTKIEAGRQHYQNYCADCHEPKLEPPNELGQQFLDLRMFPVWDVGTDPTDAVNFATRTLDARKLYGPDAGNIPGPTVINDVITGVMQRYYKDHNIPPEEQVEWNFYRKIGWRANPCYPARPLNGIWATPPFLHNGSVANLYELLLPPEQRMKEFYLGNLEFDPVKVGYQTEKMPGGFLLDTSITDNSNAGHDYGTHLNDEERYELIEFMKALKFTEEDYKRLHLVPEQKDYDLIEMYAEKYPNDEAPPEGSLGGLAKYWKDGYGQGEPLEGIDKKTIDDFAKAEPPGCLFQRSSDISKKSADQKNEEGSLGDRLGYRPDGYQEPAKEKPADPAKVDYGAEKKIEGKDAPVKDIEAKKE